LQGFFACWRVPLLAEQFGGLSEILDRFFLV
jgi:hypothetical protein